MLLYVDVYLFGNFEFETSREIERERERERVFIGLHFA